MNERIQGVVKMASLKTLPPNPPGSFLNTQSPFSSPSLPPFLPFFSSSFLSLKYILAGLSLHCPMPAGASSPGKREKDLGGRKEPRRQGGARGPEVRRAAEVRRAEAAAWRPERGGGGSRRRGYGERCRCPGVSSHAPAGIGLEPSAVRRAADFHGR